jgi:hypothetical protein
VHRVAVLRSRPIAAAALALVAGTSAPRRAGGDAAEHDVASVFYVAKSENKNQVHYALRMDASCAPAGREPIRPYWRMLERGTQVTEPLLAREVNAYGLAEQTVLERGPGGGRLSLRLHALPNRLIVVETSALPGGECGVVASTVIAGVRASLTRAFVQLRWPFGVDYIVLSGRSLADGQPVQERLSP